MEAETEGSWILGLAVLARNDGLVVFVIPVLRQAQVNPQFRVVGNTGVAWSHAAVALKPKDGQMATSCIRYTYTFTKSDGKWLQVVRHFSLFPSGS